MIRRIKVGSLCLRFYLDQEVDSPFDMSRIKTPGVDDEPGRERVNFVRARLEQEQKADQSGQIKSDLIMIKPDIVASCAIAGPKISETAERKKAKRVENAMAIVSTDDYRKTRFGRIPGNSARILWRADGTCLPRRESSIFQWTMNTTAHLT